MELPINRIVKGDINKTARENLSVYRGSLGKKADVSSELMNALPDLDHVLRYMGTKRGIKLGDVAKTPEFHVKAQEIYDKVKADVQAEKISFFEFENEVVKGLVELAGLDKTAQEGEAVYYEGCECGGLAFPSYYEDTGELVLRCTECGQEFESDEEEWISPVNVEEMNARMKEKDQQAVEVKEWEERWGSLDKTADPFDKYYKHGVTGYDTDQLEDEIVNYAVKVWELEEKVSDEDMYDKIQQLRKDVRAMPLQQRIAVGRNYYNQYFSHFRQGEYSISSPKTPRMQKKHKELEKELLQTPKVKAGEVVVTADDLMVVATGEPDQDYDHEFYDEIVKQLEASGFPGSTHREFDKYQGVYLKVPYVDTFWVDDVRNARDGSTAYIFVPEDIHIVRGIFVMKFEDGTVDAGELIEFCKDYDTRTPPPSKEVAEWEERWGKMDNFKTAHNGNEIVIEVLDMEPAKEKAIDRLKPLPTMWYENDEGEQYILSEDELKNAIFPEDYPLQYFLDAQVVEEMNYTDGRGHLMTGHKTINCVEPIVLYLILKRGWKMTDAIVVAAETCERCMNILLEEAGDEKYKQEEKDSCHTHCEQCAIIDPEYDKWYKTTERWKEDHPEECELAEVKDQDKTVKESAWKDPNTMTRQELKVYWETTGAKEFAEAGYRNWKALGFDKLTHKKRARAIAGYMMIKGQWGEEFKANQFVIFTQDCQFRMDQLDAMGEIKENMIGKVKTVTDDGITIEIGKQEYSIPYIEAYRVIEPFRAKVVAPEGGKPAGEGMPEEMPEGMPETGQEGVIPEEGEGLPGGTPARPEIGMERGERPVPIRGPMKPLEKALQVETVLKGMMNRLALRDTRKELTKGTPVSVQMGNRTYQGTIVNTVGNDYQIKTEEGRLIIVPLEAISYGETPQKEAPREMPREVPKEAPKPQEPQGDFPVGSEVWVEKGDKGKAPYGGQVRGFIERIEGDNYTIRTYNKEKIVVPKEHLTLISHPKEPIPGVKKYEKLPYPPYKYTKKGLTPVYPTDTVPKGTDVYVEVGQSTYFWGRVVEQSGDQIGVKFLDGTSDYYPITKVYYIEMPLETRKKMLEKFTEWQTETEAGMVSSEMVITAEIYDKYITIESEDVLYRWLDDYEGRVNEDDIDHIGKLILDGMTSGELISTDKDNPDETHRGWWELRKTEGTEMDESLRTCIECRNEFNADVDRDLDLCDDCIKLFDTEGLWAAHDRGELDAMDFNADPNLREKYRLPDKVAVWEDGEHIKDWATDKDPETGEVESNAGQMHVIRYEDAYYVLETKMGEEDIYSMDKVHPDEYEQYNLKAPGGEEIKEWEERWGTQGGNIMDKEIVIGTTEVNDQMLDKDGMWLSREMWRPKVEYCTEMIETLLGRIESGINVTSQIEAYLSQLNDVLEKVPPDQILSAEEYVGEFMEKQRKKGNLLDRLVIKTASGEGIDKKKPLKELNKIIKKRDKEYQKDQKDIGKDSSHEPERQHVQQDVNFGARPFSSGRARHMFLKRAQDIYRGQTVEILSGIHKGDTGKVKERYQDWKQTNYRVEIAGQDFWLEAKNVKPVGMGFKAPTPEPAKEEVTVGSSQFKKTEADIMAGFKLLIDEIEHSRNPYVVSEIGKKLYKKENKENEIVREGSVSR